MDIEVVRERFDELLKVLAASGLPSATRRTLWLAALDAFDKAVAEGRISNWPVKPPRPGKQSKIATPVGRKSRPP